MHGNVDELPQVDKTTDASRTAPHLLRFHDCCILSPLRPLACFVDQGRFSLDHRNGKFTPLGDQVAAYRRAIARSLAR